MGRKVASTNETADYKKYIYYLKGQGKTKSLYRATRKGIKGKKLLVKDVVESKDGMFYYVKPSKTGKLSVYSTKRKKGSRARKRSRKRSRKPNKK